MRIAVAIVLTAFSLKGGAVMKGRIVLNEIEGQAVKGVTVNAPGAANQTLSTENGTFTMEFPKLNPGDRVKLVLSQPGMEVVNWVQLDAVLAADYKGANELKLILAKGGRDREEMARRYFRLRSLEAVEANYRRLLGQAGQDGARLRRELDQAKSAVDRLAEELAKVKPGDASALYERAMRLYLEGKVTEAIEALDEAKLREMSQAALERKAQAEKQIAEVTRSWLLKGKLLTTQFRFPEAEKAYGEAVQLAPGDFEACFEQARFQQMLNRREASLETQTRCMRLAEISNKPRDVAASLRSIGDINTERDSIQEARTALDRALIIGRGLAASGTKDDQALMADVLDSLGSLELKDNRLQQALQAYKEAHDLYSQLAVGNPERYSYGVGSTLNNIGLVMRRENRVEEALEAYEKALAVERRVAQADNDRFRPEIARTLNNLGSLHLNHNQILVNDSRRRKAEAAYVEALSIFERLAQVNPETYMPEVAGLQNNLGLFYHSENHRAKALRSYQSALSTYQSLAVIDPKVYVADVAMVFSNLGDLNREDGRLNEAMLAYQEALATYRTLAKSSPGTYLEDVASVRWHMGWVHSLAGERDYAQRAYGEALEIYEGLLARGLPVERQIRFLRVDISR